MQSPTQDPGDHAGTASEAPSGAENTAAEHDRVKSQPPSVVKDGLKLILKIPAKFDNASVNRGTTKSVASAEDGDSLEAPMPADSQALTTLAATPSNLVAPSVDEGYILDTAGSSTGLVAIAMNDGPAMPLSGSLNPTTSVVNDCSGSSTTALIQPPTLDAPSTMEDPAALVGYITASASPIEPQIYSIPDSARNLTER